LKRIVLQTHHTTNKNNVIHADAHIPYKHTHISQTHAQNYQ